MISLLAYIEQQFTFWRYLTRRERMNALNGILPTIKIGIEPKDAFECLTTPRPTPLADVHVSMDSHYTRIRTYRGVASVFDHATYRLGYEPDLELPLVGSRGGELHVLESLVVM